MDSSADHSMQKSVMKSLMLLYFCFVVLLLPTLIGPIRRKGVTSAGTVAVDEFEICRAGVASQSVMWGPWATGMAAANPRVAANFARAGLTLLSPAVGLRLLEQVTAAAAQQGTVVAAPISWPKLLAAAPKQPGLLAEFQGKGPVTSAAAEQSTPTATKADLQERVTHIVAAMLNATVPADQVSVSSAQIHSCCAAFAASLHSKSCFCRDTCIGS